MDRKYQLDSILEQIDRSPELTLFFTRLTEPDPTFAKLFLLHQDELFPKLPYLFWNNLPSDAKSMDKRGIVETLVQLEEIKSEHAMRRLSALFSLAEGGMSEETKDLFMYVAIKIARQNEGLRRLITAGDFSFRLMKEALGDYRNLNLNLPEKLPELDEHILRKKGMQVAAPIIENIQTDGIAGILEKLACFPPDILMSLHAREAGQHLTEVLETSGIEKDDYMETITELFSLGLILNVHTIFWCENCQDRPQLLKTTSQLSPHHLKISCPRCKKLMSVGSIFRVHELLRQCIVSKDGLLTVALAWLLKKNNVKYDASIREEYEYDFVCRAPVGDFLIECKMHRRPSNDRSFHGTLEEDLKQTSEHFKTLKKTNQNLKEGHLLYNYDLEDHRAEIEKLSSKYGNINLIDYHDFDELVQRMKPT